jgi:uncharacterized protein YndB with AHSA1/START domain
MDLHYALGAEFRKLSEREYLGKRVRVVAASRIYPTSQADLWNAITNKERLPRWFASVEGNFELNGRFQIEGNANGRIIRCEAPKVLELTWEISSSKSWVHVRLNEEAKGTRLLLEHLMEKDGLGEEHWNKYGPGATGVGWDYGFLDLGLHLDSPGQDIDRSDHDRWLISDDGKAWARQCASAWGDAHIKAGKDEDTARTMAENTANFYAGE